MNREIKPTAKIRKVLAIYYGEDYPNLTPQQEYKLTLTLTSESSPFTIKTNLGEESLTCSGLDQFLDNFTQVHTLKKSK